MENDRFDEAHNGEFYYNAYSTLALRFGAMFAH